MRAAFLFRLYHTVLATYINLRIRRGFIAGIGKNDYDTVVPKWLKDRTGKNHYTFCVWICLGFISDWREQYGISERIHYIFDRMGKGKGEIMRAFDGLINNGHHNEVGAYRDGIAFEPKTDFIPLQAADMLAAGAGWQLNNRILPKVRRPTQPWFTELMRKRAQNGVHSADSLRKYVVNMEKHKDDPKWGI